MSDNVISLNRKKIKASTSIRGLYNEYTRDEKNAKKYDDGTRLIDTNKTKFNEVLFDKTDGHIEKMRHEKIRKFNKLREIRTDLNTIADAPDTFTKKKSPKYGKQRTLEEKQDWVDRANRVKTRKLQKNSNDMLENVVQLGVDALSGLDEEQQELAYKSALNVMLNNPKDYGDVYVAALHKDENSMHLQVLTNILDDDTLDSNANKIFGNKSKMSNAQDIFVNQVNEDLAKHGYDFGLKRGIKRIDNPDYQGFKSEMKRDGYEVTRYNDRELKPLYEQKKKLEDELSQADVARRDVTRDMFDAVQQTKHTEFVYNRAVNNGDGSLETDDPLQCLKYTGYAKKDSETYKQSEAEAVQDVKEFNEEEKQPNSIQRVGLWMRRKMEEYEKKTSSRYRGIKDAIGRAYFDTVVALQPAFGNDENGMNKRTKVTINDELEGKREPGRLMRYSTVKFMQGRGKFTKNMESAYIRLRTKQDNAKKEYEQKQQRTNFGPEV